MKYIFSGWPGVLLVLMSIFVGSGVVHNGMKPWKNSFHVFQWEHNREINSKITFPPFKFIPIGHNQFNYSSNGEVEFSIVEHVIRSVYSRGCDITDIDLAKGHHAGSVFISQFIISCRKY